MGIEADADDAFFSAIDSDLKAYALGRIASEAAIQRETITLFIPREDVNILTALRDAICPTLPIRPKNDGRLVRFTLTSPPMVSDVCRWLEIAPGTQDAVVSFPPLANDALKWAFLRGYFDGDGSVDSPREKSSGPTAYPRCKIASASTKLLEAIESFCAIPCQREADHVEWTGNNALDFLSRIYDGAPIATLRKRARYEDWSTWVPGLTGHHGRDVLFRWVKTLPAARPPTKAHASDSGYDITLIQPGHRVGAVQFYRTGLKIQPSFGWYFDLVPRSSITKTGYILANSVGVIDRTYVGEVLVPLIKIDPNAPDLELPARVAQIIPRPIVHAEFVEVESLDESRRGSGGFGSTGHR